MKRRKRKNKGLIIALIGVALLPAVLLLDLANGLIKK